MKLNEEFWTERYNSNQIGWDLGDISTPLKEYFDQLEDKSLKILIPGGGNSYETQYLFENGFENVYVVDIAQPPLDNLKKRCPAILQNQLIHDDFFKLADQFDLIVEQTFFCALDPSLRSNYAHKMHELLRSGGKLVGVLFNIPLNDDHPPFGGNKDEYLKYFDPLFDIKVMESCYNSIEPRSGNELFMILERIKNDM